MTQKYDAAWFKAVLDAMHDMVLVKDPRSHLLWANKAFRDYYGMSEADLHQFIDADNSDPDDTLQYVIDDQAVFDRAASLDIPSESVTNAAGQVRQFHTIKSPIFEDGQVVRSVGVCRLLKDSEIQRREVDHDDAKAFVAPLRALARCFPNPMLMVDVKKRILNSNGLWDAAFGDPGHSPNSFFDDHYRDMPKMVAAVEACLNHGNDVQLDVQVVRPDGAPFHYSLALSPWSFPDGALGGVTIVATDISELFRRTEALQRANDELMQFSYRASHDLKGPLSTIKGLAAFIIDDIQDGDTGEAARSAGQITRTAGRLEHTVLSILELARADLKENIAERFDLSDIIDEIRDGQEQAIVQGDIRVLKDLNVRYMTSQVVRVRQILENLISNSVKYHSDAREDRFVKISADAVAGNILLSVADNGIGIPEAAQSAVFDLFSRFEASRDGAGLGLAIVEKHVKALSGSIDLVSDANGTVFHVKLPNMEPERLVS